MAEPLAPQDIETVTFPTSLRGYDRDSVDIFLQEVATAYERALSEAQSARAGASKPYKGLGEEMGDLLQHAKDSADATRKAAEAEAQTLRDEAIEVAEATRTSAAREAAEIRASAEREAADKIEDAAETVAQLEAMETEARRELRTLRLRLDVLSEQLRALETQGESRLEEAAPPPPYVPSPPDLSLVEESDFSDDGSSNEAVDEPTV